MVLESVDDLYYARNSSKYDYSTIRFEYNDVETLSQHN